MSDLPATGKHQWNEGVVTKEPTATESGIKTFTCKVCQATKTEDIPKVVVDELAQELTDVKVGKVNVDEQMALAREYKVMSIPTFLVFKDGKVAERTLGVQEKSELEQLIR